MDIDWSKGQLKGRDKPAIHRQHHLQARMLHCSRQ